MSDFIFDSSQLENIIDESVKVGAYMTLSLSQDRTPRDLERLPKPIVLKTKDVPERNIRKGNKKYYRKPVNINGQWYEGVSGALKRSLDVEKLGKGEYIVGVKRGPTEIYAEVQEFGSNDGVIPSRSFLRETLVQDGKKILDQVQNTFNELLK